MLLLCDAHQAEQVQLHLKWQVFMHNLQINSFFFTFAKKKKKVGKKEKKEKVKLLFACVRLTGLQTYSYMQIMGTLEQ